MSSYQFVNSLTSCYGQPRAGPDPSGASGPSPADYYTPQAYNSCYGAAPSAAAAAAAAVAGQPASPAYPAYLQQNGGGGSDHHGGGSAHSHHGHHGHPAYSTNNSCSQGSSRLPSSHHAVSPAAAQAPGPARTPTPSSCKYALDTASSPQDLSTSSTGAASVSEGSRGSPANTQSQSGSRGGSSSATNAANSEGGKSGAGSQPQIYPWMRKVHVGQSKFGKSKDRCSCRCLLWSSRPVLSRPFLPSVLPRSLPARRSSALHDARTCWRLARRSSATMLHVGVESCRAHTGCTAFSDDMQ